MQKTAAFLMVSVLLLGLFLMRESRQGAGARLETEYADWIATNSSQTPEAASPAHVAHITLVEINDSSLSSEHAWPWSPLEYAVFLRTALPFKPEVVAIEPALNWKETRVRGSDAQKMEQYRAALREYILQTPKLVLGAELDTPEDEETVPPLQPAPLLPARNIKGDKHRVPMFQEIAAQAEEDFRLSASTGFTNLPQDQGDIIHRAPLLFNYQGEIVPSFALQTLMQWFKVTPDDVQVDLGSHIALGKAATIPIDEEGTMEIDFGSRFARVGEDDLMLAVSEQQEQPGQDAKARTSSATDAAKGATDALKGSIVLLARTDSGARTFTVPSLAKESRGEICAAALATVLDRAYGRRAPAAFDFAVIAAMMAASCFFHRFAKRAFALASFLGLLFYVFLCMSVQALWLVRLPFIVPLGLLLLVNFFSIFIERGTPGAPGPVAQAPAPRP
ncbi:MAG TPA: CHASE2 domain-containing protein [Chthoniobacteraceae bacterium]|nr:CHASE2 domain-containing protein [Chthoniobacteraceae bacterium]